MIRDVLTACALIVSVTGIGVSLAREEMRCYLGLQSSECSTSEVKSASPSLIQKINSDTQTTSSDPEFNPNKTLTRITKPLFSNPEDSNSQSSSEIESSPNSNHSESTEPHQIDSVSPVEEVSRSQPLQVQPFVEQNNSSDAVTTPSDSSSSTEVKSFGIPIKVEPFQEPK